ncbi:MAG: protein SCO1/2 [Flavobacteriales bacterium]|jgi:protein SCO1/2|tara:strand:- start:2102 stop:2770 length:669 start_codon:yes stop_codon:yes gene_type:complete
MATKSGETNRLLIFGVILVLGMLVVYPMLKRDPRLKIYKPSDVNPRLVDESVRNYELEHSVAEFELYSQDSVSIGLSSVEGKIYVADFFFTTCGNICPKMTTQMKILHDFYFADEDIMFVSHTVYPEEDSVSTLRAYADKYQIDSNKWLLLTGEKEVIYDLARKSYFAVLTEGDGGERDFIHTENFMLLDKKQRIRGYYDGTLPEDMIRLKKDIEILRLEYI